MATITWEQVSLKCGDDNNVTITIEEFADGAPTGKQYSARLHKDRHADEFNSMLKKQILADRSNNTEENTLGSKFDFSDFENYLNK